MTSIDFGDTKIKYLEGRDIKTAEGYEFYFEYESEELKINPTELCIFVPAKEALSVYNDIKSDEIYFDIEQRIDEFELSIIETVKEKIKSDLDYCYLYSMELKTALINMFLGDMCKQIREAIECKIFYQTPKHIIEQLELLDQLGIAKEENKDE